KLHPPVPPMDPTTPEFDQALARIDPAAAEFDHAVARIDPAVTAGSGNSGHLVSGNSGHLEPPDSKAPLLVETVHEERGDQHAEATRDSGSPPGRTLAQGDRRAGRSRKTKRSTRRG